MLTKRSKLGLKIVDYRSRKLFPFDKHWNTFVGCSQDLYLWLPRLYYFWGIHRNTALHLFLKFTVMEGTEKSIWSSCHQTISPPRIELSLALVWTFMNGNFLTVTLFSYFKEPIHVFLVFALSMFDARIVNKDRHICIWVGFKFEKAWWNSKNLR